MVVDDEPVILEMLKMLFRDGYDVAAFATGTAALEHMERHGVDVLLTDKNLPDIGGLELLGHAKRICEDAEVLIITGFASLDTALEALQLGAFDYIVKPPKSIFDVRRKVEQAFGRQQMARENKRLLETQARTGARGRQPRSGCVGSSSPRSSRASTLAAVSRTRSAHRCLVSWGWRRPSVKSAVATIDYANEIVTYSKSIKEIVVQLSGYSRTAGRVPHDHRFCRRHL